MTEFVGDFKDRIEHRKKAASAPSLLLANSLDLIDSALWLIAGDRIAQALSSLHNAIELIFKAELERVHRVLIADSRQLDYKSLKSLLKDAFADHPRGKSLAIEDFDLQKTITFSEAMSRAKDLYPQIGRWEKQLKGLQIVRNDIVHYGSDREKDDEYAQLIAATALPFLIEFLRDSNGIDLREFIGDTVYRELEIAIAVCQQMQSQSETSYARALKTVKYALLYCDVPPPVAFANDAVAEATLLHESMRAESLRRRLSWTGRKLEVFCKICGSVDAFAEVDVDEDDEVLGAFPVSVACAKCRLEISRADSPLPQFHFGALTEQDIIGGLDKF